LNLLLFVIAENDCRTKIGKLANGRIEIAGTSYRSKAYYRCNAGYDNYPPGVNYQVCGGQGWMGASPECSEY